MPRVFENAGLTAAWAKFDLCAIRKKNPQVQKPLANKKSFVLLSLSSLTPLPQHTLWQLPLTLGGNSSETFLMKIILSTVLRTLYCFQRYFFRLVYKCLEKKYMNKHLGLRMHPLLFCTWGRKTWGSVWWKDEELEDVQSTVYPHSPIVILAVTLGCTEGTFWVILKCLLVPNSMKRVMRGLSLELLVTNKLWRNKA